MSGKQYVRYGGDTTCFEITAKTGETIIVDAGTGIRALGNSAIDRDIKTYHLLFTHVHWDHILGFPFFRPLLYSQVKMTIQDRLFGQISTCKALNQVMKPPFFPVQMADLNADLVFDDTLTDQFSIGSIEVETIPTSHTDGGLGYKFSEDGKCFVLLTDSELNFDHPGNQGMDRYADFARGVDLLIHDAEYTRDEYRRKTGWGHSSIEAVLDLAVLAGVKRLGLFHISQDRSDDQMDAIVKQSVTSLKKRNPDIECFAVPALFEIQI